MRRTGLSALALLLLGMPRAPTAQAQELAAHAWLEGSLAVTSVRESSTTYAGVAGLISVGGRFAFGAGGALMVGSSTVEGDGTGSDLDLRLAHGGLILQLTVLGSPDRHVALRALIGAGNAKIELPVVGSEVAADNFGVLEPQLVGTLPLIGPLRIGLGAGYRHVFGVNDLPNVAPSDLEGPTAGIRLSIGTR